PPRRQSGCKLREYNVSQKSRNVTDSESVNNSGIGLSANIETQKMEKPLDGGFKLCDEVTTLNSITNFLRT
ncbi:TPA: hypothetical protein ACH9NW_004900, partial [Escherichia coli]